MMTIENESALPRSTDGRRVLMIAAAFPPTGGPGVQRSAKFARYLPQFGWKPVVWTLNRLEGLPADPTLRAELPASVTVHTRSAPRGLLRALCRALHRAAHERRADRSHDLLSRLAGACSWRLESYLTGRSFPDEFAGWAQKSVRPLERIIQAQSIGAIYSTFSPASNHLLALLLKKKTGLPWIADFRDLWTDDYCYREPRPERHQENLRLEKEILETADVIVGVTPAQTDLLARHVPAMRAKFRTITNGFDPADFDESPTSSPTSKRVNGSVFVLAHVGRFDKWRVGDALLDGLGRFAAELGADRERFELRIVGHADPATLARVASTGVRYTFSPHVAHRQAIREMAAADALLLAMPDGPNAESVIAAKMFEYLASRRPIVVVGPAGGACARIVTTCRAGVTADFDAPSVAAALGRLYRIWVERRPLFGCAPADAEPFSRVALTRQLASVLDELVGPGGEGCLPSQIKKPAALELRFPEAARRAPEDAELEVGDAASDSLLLGTRGGEPE